MGDGNDERWVSISEAARLLGTGRAAVYGRIKRDTLPARRGNDNAWRVMVTDAVVEASRTAAAQRHDDTANDDHVTTLRVELARAEERLAAGDRELADKAERLASVEDELVKVQANLDQARAELLAEVRRAWWRKLFGLR